MENLIPFRALPSSGQLYPGHQDRDPRITAKRMRCFNVAFTLRYGILKVC